MTEAYASGVGAEHEHAQERARSATKSGMALVSVLLVMMLMSALLIGFFAVIAADQRASGVNRDQTQAYAAAHAGLEKLTADLGRALHGRQLQPHGRRSSRRWRPVAAGTAGLPVRRPRTARRGYTITGRRGRRWSRSRSIPTARRSPTAYQGLIGLITPYEITVTAGRTAGRRGESRMRREMQTDRGAGVPVRHLLGERPQLLRRPELRLRRPGALQPEHLPRPGRQHADARRTASPPSARSCARTSPTGCRSRRAATAATSRMARGRRVFRNRRRRAHRAAPAAARQEGSVDSSAPCRPASCRSWRAARP